jgi:hypothetical protein
VDGAVLTANNENYLVQIGSADVQQFLADHVATARARGVPLGMLEPEWFDATCFDSLEEEKRYVAFHEYHTYDNEKKLTGKIGPYFIRECLYASHKDLTAMDTETAIDKFSGVFQAIHRDEIDWSVAEEPELPQSQGANEFEWMERSVVLKADFRRSKERAEQDEAEIYRLLPRHEHIIECKDVLSDATRSCLDPHWLSSAGGWSVGALVLESGVVDFAELVAKTGQFHEVVISC